jgi:hypothetical protein
VDDFSYEHVGAESVKEGIPSRLEDKQIPAVIYGVNRHELLTVQYGVM